MMAHGSMLIPSFRYKDAHAAMDWLELALGFVRNVVFEGPENTVAHAQMTFGETGMIMLGSASNPNPSADRIARPEEVGGRVTSPVYLVSAETEALYERAKAVGAEVESEIRTMEYGGKAFALRDPEGYLWSVGQYNPWDEQGAESM